MSPWDAVAGHREVDPPILDLWNALTVRYKDEKACMQAVLDAEAKAAQAAKRPQRMLNAADVHRVLRGPVAGRPADTLALLGLTPDGKPLN